MKKVWGCAALAVAVVVAGCGGDDDGGDGDLAAYCELVEEADSRDGFPSDEEIEAFLDVAPEEVRDDIETLTDAFRDVEDPDDVEALLEALEEPEVAEAIEDIEAFDADRCDAGGSSSSSNDADEDSTTTTETDDADDTDDTDADADADDDEGASGTLCERITDEQVSEVVGVELSSADTLFNDEDNCTYESAEGDAELVLNRLPDPGLTPGNFLSNAEVNFDDFEELDGIDAEAAYFITSEFSGAMAGALGDDQVLSVTWDDGGDDPLANRDEVIELLELLLET